MKCPLFFFCRWCTSCQTHHDADVPFYLSRSSCLLQKKARIRRSSSSYIPFYVWFFFSLIPSLFICFLLLTSRRIMFSFFCYMQHLISFYPLLLVYLSWTSSWRWGSAGTYLFSPASKSQLKNLLMMTDQESSRSLGSLSLSSSLFELLVLHFCATPFLSSTWIDPHNFLMRSIIIFSQGLLLFEDESNHRKNSFTEYKKKSPEKDAHLLPVFSFLILYDDRHEWITSLDVMHDHVSHHDSHHRMLHSLKWMDIIWWSDY